MSGLGLHNNDRIRDGVMLALFILILLVIAYPRLQAMRQTANGSESIARPAMTAAP